MFTTAFLACTASTALCRNPHTRSRSTLFRAAKRAPYQVLATRMPRVMDGRAMSSGHCYKHSNPALQPSHYAVVIVILLALAPPCSTVSPLFLADRKSTPFILSALLPHTLF